MGVIRDLWNLLDPVAPTPVDDWGKAISDEIDNVPLETRYWFAGPMTPYLAGRYYGTNNITHSVVSAVTGNDILRAVPFQVVEAHTFDRIGVTVLTAGSASARMRLGVYEDTTGDGTPDSLVVDAGEIDTSTTGFKEITFGTPISLVIGKIYGLAFVANENVNLRAVSRSSGARMFAYATGTGTDGDRMVTWDASHTYGPLQVSPSSLFPPIGNVEQYIVVLRAT